MASTAQLMASTLRHTINSQRAQKSSTSTNTTRDEERAAKVSELEKIIQHRRNTNRSMSIFIH
jgi:hypothetical protein